MSDGLELTNNNTIYSEDGSKAVTVTTDGIRERLDVSLGSALSFQLQAFTPLTAVDSTGVSLSTGAWTTLLNVTATKGKLNFIACSGSTSSYRVRVTVDGVESYNVSMDDLNSIGLANATNVEIWAETANKNFRYHPKTPVDFTSSILIELQATSATPTVTSYVSYREQQ